MTSLEVFEVDSINDVDAVMNVIRKYGICIIRKFIEEDDLRDISNEHNRILKSKTNNTKAHPGNKDGVVCALRRSKLNELEVNTTIKYFYSDQTRAIADKYYSQGHNFNEYIFFTNEKHDPNPILPWHHDRSQSLKFYLYLIDTNVDNGAFEFVPGSHKYGYYRANYYIATGCPIDDIPNDIPDEEIFNPVSFSLNAGDLIIFDADGFHRGGIVREGQERKVIRAQTYPYPYSGYSKPKLFSPLWWAQSFFNPVKHFKKQLGRNMSDEFRPGATNAKLRGKD